MRKNKFVYEEPQILVCVTESEDIVTLSDGGEGGSSGSSDFDDLFGGGTNSLAF